MPKYKEYLSVADTNKGILDKKDTVEIDTISSNDNPLGIEIEGKELVLSRPIYNRIVQLYCCGCYNIRQIGDILNLSEATVTKHLRREEVQEAIIRYQKEETAIIDQALKQSRLKATMTMVELLDAENEMVRLQASKDLLDRTGHKAMEKKQVDVNIKSFEQQINDIFNAEEYIEAEIVED